MYKNKKIILARAYNQEFKDNNKLKKCREVAI